jgi:hypothetical protein
LWVDGYYRSAHRHFNLIEYLWFLFLEVDFDAKPSLVVEPEDDREELLAAANAARGAIGAQL